MVADWFEVEYWNADEDEDGFAETIDIRFETFDAARIVGDTILRHSDVEKVQVTTWRPTSEHTTVSNGVAAHVKYAVSTTDDADPLASWEEVSALV